MLVDAAFVPDPEVDVLHSLLVVIQKVAVSLIELTKLTAGTVISYLALYSDVYLSYLLGTATSSSF